MSMPATMQWGTARLRGRSDDEKRTKNETKTQGA